MTAPAASLTAERDTAMSDRSSKIEDEGPTGLPPSPVLEMTMDMTPEGSEWMSLFVQGFAPPEITELRRMKRRQEQHGDA